MLERMSTYQKLKCGMMLGICKKSQTFWNIVEKLSPLCPMRYFKKPPQSIIVEPTNYCNLRCPVCPTHFAMKRKRGFMDFDLFKLIINDFDDIENKPRIDMNFAGEPLLNRNIDKFIKYASENNHKTLISTNATLLTKRLSKRLIKAGLTTIFLCLDGIKKESHEAYRIGSNFENVKKNIEDFILVKREINTNSPTVIVQTLLTSFSENEIVKIIDWGRSIGVDNIDFKSFSLGSFTTMQMKKKYAYLLPKKKEFRRKICNVHKTICTLPINRSVIFWNGDLGLCCIDFNNELKLPNIKENGFLATFNSNDVIYKRKLAFRKKLALCNKCSRVDADFGGIRISPSTF